MNQQFGQLLVAGAKTGERPIVAAHAAVRAVFAAIIGKLDDGAHKHLFAEFLPGHRRGAFVQSRLRCAVRCDIRFCRKVPLLGHSAL
jgi:hypothetical protein